MSCSLKFQYIVSCGVKIFPLGHVCASFHIVPQPHIVLCSVLLTVFHFLYSSILLFISCVIHGFRTLLSTLLTISLILSNTHFIVLLHSTATFRYSKFVTVWSRFMFCSSRRFMSGIQSDIILGESTSWRTF
jgi:hypothetical protein